MLHGSAPTGRSTVRTGPLAMLGVVVLTLLVVGTLGLAQPTAVASSLPADPTPTADTPSPPPEVPGPPSENPAGPDPDTSGSSSDGRPNVLLITTDDQAVGDLAHMPRTRELLGDQGATFTDAVSSYPLCCPARASILTGQLSHNHGVRTNKPPYGGWDGLRRQEDVYSRTLGVWLQDAGYHTMFTGKYLNGYKGREALEVPPGWDNWLATSGNTYNYTDFRANLNGRFVRYEDSYQTDVFGDFTRQHIAESVDADKPFFVWESQLAPHDACVPRPEGSCRWTPATPAAQDADKFRRLGLGSVRDAAFNERVVTEKPAHVRSLRPWTSQKKSAATHKHRQRIRSLQAVDRSVAQTAAQLAELGELDNTLIIFASDNGYMLGEHRWQGKILPYEPSLQIPLLMRWTDGDIPAGVRRDKTAALVDIPRTIADAAGVEPMLTPDGRSLLPVARGERGAPGYGAMSIESGQQGWDTSDHRWFYRGVRTARYTFVRYARTGEDELYDRRIDPDQLNNVAYRPEYRETRDALVSKLRALQDCAGQACLDEGGRVPRPLPEPHLSSGKTVHPDELGSIGSARRVVTLTAMNWRTGRGTATAWTRHGRTWTVRRGPFPVKLGARGLVQPGLRRDGADETPAGTYTAAFALGHRPNPGTSLPYRRFDEDDYWVMDRRVPETYNVYQDQRPEKARWRKSAAQHWWAQRGRYQHALMLDFNLPRGLRSAKAGGGQSTATRPADVRKGSLALHSGPRQPGRGWVSMRPDHVRWLVRWSQSASGRTAYVLGTPDYLRNRL